MQKHLRVPGMRPHLHALADAIRRGRAIRSAELGVIAEVCGGRARVKPAALIHATRVAVTGRSVSPGLYECWNCSVPRARV